MKNATIQIAFSQASFARHKDVSESVSIRCTYQSGNTVSKNIRDFIYSYDDFANFAPQKKKTGNMPEEMFIIYDTDCTDEPMFDRGFTGHEHLYNFGLINMNGRVYDPQMSRSSRPTTSSSAPTTRRTSTGTHIA